MQKVKKKTYKNQSEATTSSKNISLNAIDQNDNIWIKTNLTQMSSKMSSKSKFCISKAVFN